MLKDYDDNIHSGQVKLPVSINDFETMRTEGYLYVDKTRHIHRMVTQGKFYFLSRPASSENLSLSPR